MSGIVSIFNLDGEPVVQSQLRQMTDYMAFRGPDAQESWCHNQIGLGHTSLRVTFESERESQPFTLDQQVWIVADARIDDRANLLSALRVKQSHLAEDVTDVELILHAYQIWDTACIDHLIGDFVFIIWDERQQRLFSARDHFGVAPLYYAQLGNTVICSNTLNCIRLHPQVSKKLNQQAMGDFLLFGMNMEFATTTWADVQRLPPAHTLTCSNGKLRIQRYWKLPRCLPLIRYRRPEEYVEHFYELFEQAVGDRLRTDRVSTHLSGGMDSTSIAATAQKLLVAKGRPCDFQAFTFSTQQEQQEDTYAGLVAKKIGIPLNLVAVDSNISARPASQSKLLLPEPSVTIPSRNFFKQLTDLCADHGRVVLSGLGGDPALYFGEFYWLEWLKHGLIGQWLAVQLHEVYLYRRRPHFYFRQGWRYWHQLASEQQPLPTFLNPAFVKQLDLQARWQQINADWLDNISRYGMANSPYWSNLFAAGDPGYNSILVKHYYPFFDLRLVSYLLAIPPVPWFVNKRILREAMDDKLPETVRTRGKKVFDTPQDYAQIMRQMVEVWIKDLVVASRLSDYVDISQLLSLIESPTPKTPFIARLIEQNLSLAYWLNRIDYDDNILTSKVY